MDELDVSDANNNDAKRLAEQFAKEKNDIVCGFLKEKEIIEMMHKEEVNELVDKYEREKESMRREFELEKENLLQGFHKQQVEKLNEFERERENLKTKSTKNFEAKERNVEMKYKEKSLQMRREYEQIIAEKNEEIKMLRRELLRVEHQENRIARESPDNDVYIKRIEHEEELRRFSENFEIEKLELERKFDREKAEMVQVFTNQTERMNANFDNVKQRMQEDHEKELNLKLEVTERLVSEKSELDKNRMLQEFEREIRELEDSLEKSYNERVLDKQQTIDNLEIEKKELLDALQTERFSLARVYNREMSLLTKPDQPTKEDVEVALIDEIAKLKQQYEDAMTEMEEQHKRKMEVVKRNQRPMRELEVQHRKEIEKLIKDFHNEKERLEDEFRKEQLHLLKSFEFERNDLEQRYEEIINERELETQQREEDLRRLYEEELGELKTIVAKQRDELEISKQKLADLADQTEEFLSEKNRIEERFQKESNQCQNLEQTLEKNLRTFEKNMKEVEDFHRKELAKNADELTREKDKLQQLEKEKWNLQKEIETLNARLDEFQKASESAIEADSEDILDSAPVGNNADAKSALEERKGEPETYRETKRTEKKRINDCLHEIRERLSKCIPKEEELTSLEDYQMSNKKMKDTINQEIVEIDKLCDSKDKDEEVPPGDEATFSLEDQLRAVENILTEDGTGGNIDKSSKDQLNEKMKDILKKAHRLHEFRKLKLKKEQKEEMSRLLKELADEKRKNVKESVEDLKYLKRSGKTGDRSQKYAESKATEERGTCTDNLSTKRDRTEERAEERPSDVVDDLRRKKEEMKRSIDELEKTFTKEKEELMEKLQTQHKEFVMSTDSEIIENLLKQKSTLEEAFNLERFYLSRLYYLEMKEELEDTLSRKKQKMKREFDRDKMNIILKYERDIADLHKLLSEKDEMELKLLQDRNDATKRLLATQRSGTPEKGKRERKINKQQLEREEETLEVTILLKKEIAELQKKRHQEHESAVTSLKEAVDLIKDIMSSSPLIAPGEDRQFNGLSFRSEDPLRFVAATPIKKSSEDGLKPRKGLLVSEEEIHNRDELNDALENLVELILNDDEESVYDSETTSGASSDLESDDSSPTTVNGESDEGAFSGPESTDGDLLSIKKAQLDFAFNLERFNLGRVYYGEYRDSLKTAMKKLAKAKENLRTKRKDLENDMLSGIKSIVDRTNFGKEFMQAPKRDVDTQTGEEKSETEDAINSEQLTKMRDARDSMESLSEVDSGLIDSQEDLASEHGEKKKESLQDKERRLQETPAELAESLIGEHTRREESIEKSEPRENTIFERESHRDDPHTELESENAPVASENKFKPKTGKEVISCTQEQGLSKIEEHEEEGKEEEDEKGSSNLEDSGEGSGGGEHVCFPFQEIKSEETKGSAKNETDCEVEMKEYNSPVEKPVGQDIHGPLEENKEIPQGSKGDQDDEKENRNDDNLDKYANAERETEDALDEGASEVESRSSGQKEPNKEEEEYQMDRISNDNSNKDTKRNTPGVIEDVDEKDAPKVSAGDKISPWEKYEERPNEDEKEIEKDEITAKGVRKDTSEEILEDTEDSGDIEVAKAGDKITFEDKNEDDRIETKTTEKEKQLQEDDIGFGPQPKKRKCFVHKGVHTPKSFEEETRKKPHQNLDERKNHAEFELDPLFHSTPADTIDSDIQHNTPVDSPMVDEDLEGEGEQENFEKSPYNNMSEPEDTKHRVENDNIPEKSDSQSLKGNVEEDELKFLRDTSPISDQDLIKQLKKNKVLQDKFNLLRELVGNRLVDEIPELSSDQKSEDSGVELESLSGLFSEKEQLASEIEQIDSQLKELIESDDDKLRDLNKQLEDEESEILYFLQEIDKQLKKNNEKNLTEHLLREKEDVCTKLDEINNLLNEKKGAMETVSNDIKTVPGLMCRRDALKDDATEKARELNYKSKMLEVTTQALEKEKEKLENSLKRLNAELAALKESLDNDNGKYRYKPKQTNKGIPPEITSLLTSKAKMDRERADLEKKSKKTERDIRRYQRMLEEQRNRLKPFQRKGIRLEETLQMLSPVKKDVGELTLRQTEEEKEARDVEDYDHRKTGSVALLAANKNEFPDEKETLNKRQDEIEEEISNLNAAISNIDLPCELDQELTDDVPTGEKLEIVRRLKVRKEDDLKRLEAEILDPQNKLRSSGFDDPVQLTQHLEENEKLKKEIAKLDSSKLSIAGSTTEEENPIVKRLEGLLLLKESLEDKLHLLDNDIFQEEVNFLDAKQFKRTGKVDTKAVSKTKELSDTKANLVKHLNDTNETIQQSLSTDGLTGPHAGFIEECVERKVKLEEEIDKLQDEIDDETTRAAEMLTELLERKYTVEEQLRKVTGEAIDEVKKTQENVFTDDEHNNNIPGENDAIISKALQIPEQEPVTASERDVLLQKQCDMEKFIKEKAKVLTEARRRGQDPGDEEQALENVIKDKISVDKKILVTLRDGKGDSDYTFSIRKTKRPPEVEKTGPYQQEEEKPFEEDIEKSTSEEEQWGRVLKDEDGERTSPSITTHEKDNNEQWLDTRGLDTNLDDRRRELRENLCVNEDRLNNLLQNAGLSVVPENNELENFKYLVVEKIKLKEEGEQLQLLEGLLCKKQTLQKELYDNDSGEDYGSDKTALLEKELKKLNVLIERRENKIQRIQTVKDAREKSFNRLSEEKEKLDERLGPLIEKINKATEDVEADIEELQRTINKKDKLCNEEQQALQQELELLHDDIERCCKEEQELEKELHRLKKESREANGDVLDLEKLLIQKESLRDYLAEIDATLDKTETDAAEQENPTKVEELLEQRRDLETTLEEIRNNKAKLDVEFEDEEMEEAMKDLAQLKKELKERQRDISEKIRNSGVLGKLAEKRKKRNIKMPRNYIQGILDKMARDEKTLTEVIKEQEDLKHAVQKQRDNLQETIAMVKSKVGDDLVNALVSSPKENQTCKENQYQSLLDEVEDNEATISDILEDLGGENEQLRKINDDLTSELGLLKEKIGENLVGELLSNTIPVKELEFVDPISSVREDEKTLQSILYEQRDKIDALEETLGKGLFHSILKKENEPDTEIDAHTEPRLVAPVIMRTIDEELENVIAIYEKELDGLSRENDVLKNMLGKDLAQEILEMGKMPEKPRKIDRIEVGTAPPIQERKADDETRFGDNKPPISEEFKEKQEPALACKKGKEDNAAITEDAVQEKDRRRKLVASKEENLSRLSQSEGQRGAYPSEERYEDPMEDTDTLPKEGKLGFAPRLFNICSSYFGSPEEKSSSSLDDDAETNIKTSLNAPKIMRDNGNTLEEIIAQYERVLQQSPGLTISQDTDERMYSPTQQEETDGDTRLHRSHSARPDGVSELDKTMESIFEAQDRNIDMLRVLKERLGEDLVDALINGRQDDYSYDLLGDSVITREDTQDNSEKQLEKTTTKFPENKPFEEIATEVTEMTPDAIDALVGSKMPHNVVDDEEGDLVQRHPLEEDKANSRKLKAPNIALENKKTLAEVIASYEEGLDSLQSKLGPSLTRTLLAMEDVSVSDIEDKCDDREGKEIRGETSDEGSIYESNERLFRGEEEAKNIEPITVSDKSAEIARAQAAGSSVKELRAPDIMATSGKTLEEVIEDYEDRISDEINQLEKEVTLLKEKLGTNLFHALLTPSSKEGVLLQAGERTTETEDTNDQTDTEETYSKYVSEEGDVLPNDLRAKSLLLDKGETVENILRSYEKQLKELSKLIPNEEGDSASVLDLISNYEDKIADLESTNKSLADRLANLAKCIGTELMQRVENLEECPKENTETEGTGDFVDADVIQAPLTMKKEDKALEKVVRNYEKELGALRKMLPSHGSLKPSVGDIVKDYEDKIDDLKNRSKCFQDEHDRLVSRIGRELADDILTLKSVDDDNLQKADCDLLMKPEVKEPKDRTRLNAPVFMRKEDTTLEGVVEIYEKALGLLPCPPVTEDYGFIDNKMHTFEDLKRENQILKDALGDGLASTLIARKGEIVPRIYHVLEASQASETGEIKLTSEAKDRPESEKQSHQEQMEDGTMVCKGENNELNTLELATDEGRTIENILKNYQKELEALRMLVPSETSEGVSVSDLVKDYEDKIEKLENENEALSDTLSNLAKNIGHSLMEDLQTLNKDNKECGGKHFFSTITSDLKAPSLMQNEKRTLEGVVRTYENELAALRKLVPHQDDQASSISDIIRDYEEKLRELADGNKNIKKELLSLHEKIGHGLVDQLNELELSKSVGEGENRADRNAVKEKNALEAPDIMNENKLPLEDILATYEHEIYNLKRENTIYHEGLGKGLAEVLIQMAEAKESFLEELEIQDSKSEFPTDEVSESTSKLCEGDEEKGEEKSRSSIPAVKENRQKLKQVSPKVPRSAAKELRATDILRDEGKDLEGILESYEKELEALRKLAPGETEEGIPVSDVIKDYENKIKGLESKNLSLSEKLNNLEKSIGQELCEALGNLQSEERQQDGEDSSGEKKTDLNAVDVVRHEDRTLENVLKNYEKELNALRKLVPRKDDESSLLSDVIKEYEDKIEEMKRQNKDLKSDLDALAEKIGIYLFDDLNKACRKKSNERRDSFDSGLQPKNVNETQKAPVISVKDDPDAGPYELKAMNLLRDEGNDLAGIIENYEKELEALRKLASGEKGAVISVSDLIKDYESKIKALERKNVTLDRKLNNLEKSVGQDLFGALENLQSESKEKQQDREHFSSDQETDLNAVDVMRDEDRTLENVVKNYEKELCALRKLVPGQDDGNSSFSDVIKEYEDKVEELQKQNKDLKNDIDSLENKLGSNMLNDLKRACREKDGNDEVSLYCGSQLEIGNEPPKELMTAEKDDPNTGLYELKATNILREDGNDLTGILESYEKELEALRKLAPGNKESGLSVSDLIKDYENKIKDMESKNVTLEGRLNNLEKSVGKDLFGALENLQSEVKQQDRDESSIEKEIDLNAVDVMRNENRTMENVVRNYEKELWALRKMVPGENDESCSISDVVKEYEDKVEELQRQNNSLKNELNALEDKIGCNLFDDLKRAGGEKDDKDMGSFDVSIHQGNRKVSEISKKLLAPDVMNENELTLETIIASYENDLDELKKEIKLLKDGLGERLANTLLNKVGEIEGLALTDDHSNAVGTSPLPPPRKGRKGVKGDRRRQTEIGRLGDGNAISSEPLDKSNNADKPASKDVVPGSLKAESLITDQGTTLENILRNYENQIEALAQVVPSDEGVSLSDLVARCEETIEELKKENDTLAKRLDNIQQKIGYMLLNEVENRESEGATTFEEKTDHVYVERLKAPQIMKEEERTLENVIKTYEKELDALRNLIPSKGEEGRTMADVVKTYEAKLDQLQTENESLKSESERLQSRIGHELVNNIKKLDEIPTNASEGAEVDTNKPVRDLKVTKIMDVKQSTLEDVLETYENALGTLLSDTSTSMHELNSRNLIDDQSDIIRELKQENDILKSSVGAALSQKLMDIAKDEKGEEDFNSADDNGDVAEQQTDAGGEYASIKRSTSALEHLSEDGKDVLSDNRFLPEELTAEALVKEEGRTIENILRNYEKELQTLKSLVLNGSGQPADTFSNLVRKYEDEKDELKKENRNFANRIDLLEKKIGPDLMKNLENKPDEKESLRSAKGRELNAPVIMEAENRTLESVIRCYEKELDALRKLAPKQEGNGHQVSISEIIKEYEEKLDDLNNEQNSLKKCFDKLTDRLGSNLLEDIKKLDDETVERDESSDVNEKGLKELKAPKIMLDESATLEDVLEKYEDALGFNVGNTNLPSKDAGKIDVFGDQLKTIREFQKENNILKSALGEKLTQSIFGASVVGKCKEDYDHNTPTKSKDGTQENDLQEGAQERKTSLTGGINLKKSLENDTYAEETTPISENDTDTTPENGIMETDTIPKSDDLKAAALIRDEGRTIENILKNYEKEIEALSKLIPQEADPEFSISDLVKHYEDKIESLEMENSGFDKRLETLKDKIGKGLVKDLENKELQLNRDADGLKAPVTMLKEGKTLENIMRNYEKEIEAFRKTVREQGQDENQYTITDIVNEYEDKLRELKSENQSLKEELGCLKQRIGPNLLEEIMSVKSTEKGEQSTPTDKDHSSKGQTRLKAPKVMEERNVTLENVLVSYESALPTIAISSLKLNADDIYAHEESAIGISKEEDKVDIKEMELLKEKVGFDLAYELVRLKKNDSGRKQRWEAVEKIEKEEKTLADILEIYEGDLERLKREKNALEVLVNGNDVDGQSALDIISQYEDEIEHLKDMTKELNDKLSILFSRVGDNLANDILSLTPDKGTSPRCSLQALEIMAMQEKQLAAVLEQYEKDLSKLTRENEALKVVAGEEKVDGDSLTSVLSDYEMKIQELLEEKKKTESSIIVLKDMIGGSLTHAMLNRSVEVQACPLDALNIMEKENKTLADVIEDYENDLAKAKREMSTLKSLVSEDPEMSSFMERVSKYEDEISNLNSKIKEQSLLEKKVGLDLSKQLVMLDQSVGGKGQEDVTLKAVGVVGKNEDATLATVLKDYEEELEKKNHEILTLKELISDDMLEIAASQESEIYELKKVKAILANELDVLFDKVGKELSNELLKRSSEQPKAEAGKLYREVVQKTENEGRPLESVIEEYVKELKDIQCKHEELGKKEKLLTEVSEKIGKDLFKELLKTDASKSTETEVRPLFEASEVMSSEGKTLGDVILSYENELTKLKRENGALHLLTEKESSADTSVIDLLSDYEGKIEKLETENRELNKRMQKVSEKVGVELTVELLKLPDEVYKSSLSDNVKELNALNMLQESQLTLNDVLRDYEAKLREGEEAVLGPLVSGEVKKEEIKLAQLVLVDEREPEISISKEEPAAISRYLQHAKSKKFMVPEPNSLDFKILEQTTPLNGDDQIKKLTDANTTLRKKLEQLSRKVGKELSEELMRSPEDEVNEDTVAVSFASVQDLDAFEDVVSERTTLAQVLESYEKRLKGTLQSDTDSLDKDHIEEEVRREQLRHTNECAEEVCGIGETEIVSHYKVPDSGLDLKEQEEELCDLDLMSLRGLILERPQIMANPKESLSLCEDRQIIEEEVIKIELPKHEESFNSEFVENLFNSDIPETETEKLSEIPDPQITEAKTDTRECEKIKVLEKEIKDLENKLEEEKRLKDKYEKDVQDLLKDIVDLKMKQAEDDEESPEDTRRRVQEEVDLKQDNKRLQEDLAKERKRRLSTEESKRDLLEEVESLMREKDVLLKQQNETNDRDKLLEDMISLRKKIGELDSKNKNLSMEVRELKELEACHNEEKSQLLANCKKEKVEMMEELVTSKQELETQLQELLTMNDDLKGTIKNLLEELKESNERLVTGGESEIEKDGEKDNSEDFSTLLLQDGQENERNIMYEREKTENLKEQLAETENALRQTLMKYQKEIKSLETEKAKLELGMTSAEQQRKDFENAIQREKERLKEDMNIELERERKRLKDDFEDRQDELTRQGKKRSRELQEKEEQWNKEREEMQEIFRIEKDKLQKAFDEELKRKIAEKDNEERQRSEQLSREFAEEKNDITATVEKMIYEQLIDKNIAVETDFQEVLSKISQEHSKEIEGVENDIRKAEERFNEDKSKLIEQSDKEKEALKKAHEEEKKALESTVQNLLKEVVKLKNQRKEIRLLHKKEKESMEEVYERDRLKLKEDWEEYKRDLLSKLQEEFDNKLVNETTKLETRLEDVTRDLEKSEERRRELEDRLRGITPESQQQSFDEGTISATTDREKEEYLKELRSVKKTLEEEYEKKLKEEKRKFEETLQGLRREIGSLQEKRRLIQDKLYNQDPSAVDRHLMEKSLANYKMEMLSKMEEEVAQKVAREKKPLEESLNEMQKEVDGLKRQRWELRNQLRRERSKLEEEFEQEKENMAKQFIKEKEELKSKLESRIQREMSKRSMENKVSRAISPMSTVSISQYIRNIASKSVC